MSSQSNDLPVYDTICFVWQYKGSQSTLTLHALTEHEAMKEAREWGWRPFKWYNPWTWENYMYCFQPKTPKEKQA